MRFAVSRQWPIAALSLWLAGISPGHGQERLDITKIYEHFVMANVAKDRCGGEAADLDQNWSENFYAVMVRTMEALRERNPSVPETRVAAATQSHTAWLRSVVESVIEREGCASAKIQELLKLYRIQASMRLR
ncbi:MAG: hypothetical protein QJR07_08860 [Acetobacteraceae bacterium]|nr:hypothetical protein [Acetobacteraceae bacterium]